MAVPTLAGCSDGEPGVFTQTAALRRFLSQTLRRMGDGDTNESNGSER